MSMTARALLPLWLVCVACTSVERAPEGAAVKPPPGELDGAFLELDCASEEIELQFCHPEDKGNREIPLSFGGEAGKAYSVVLGVWAVTETVTYQGGSKAGEHFYIGGASATPHTAEYGLRVGDKTYFLNHMDADSGEHYTYGYQYVTPAITIPGGATVVLFVHNPQTPDDLINTNHMVSVADNPPPRLQQKLAVIHSRPLEGQYVYLEVQSVK
jgi:hypothetical protein